MKIVLLEMGSADSKDTVPSNDKMCFTGILKIFFELTADELEKFHEIVSFNSGRNIHVGGLCFTYAKSNPTYKVSVLLTAMYAKKLFGTTNRSEVSGRIKVMFEKILGK